MIDDRTIAAACDALADTAPSPERVRARVQARTRARRQRPLLLAGAVGAAAAVTSVPLLDLRRRRPAVPPVDEMGEPVETPFR